MTANVGHAAEFSDEYIRQMVLEGDLEELTPLASVVRWRCGFRWVNGASPYLFISDAFVDQVVGLAFKDEGVRQLCLRAAASQMLAGLPVQQGLRQLSILAIQQSLPSLPKPRGKKRHQNWSRDMNCIILIQELCDRFKLSPTQNNDRSNASSAPFSACEVVAASYAKTGRHDVTSRALKEIWTNKAKRAAVAELLRAVEDHQTSPLNALA